IGIPEEAKKHLFEKEWGNRSTHGLFLIHEVLAVTGITIRETGEPGKGACFELLVPNGKYRQIR
ncbi:MAG: ATP-binding protein, partial [Methanoregulaceae archaeon]